MGATVEFVVRRNDTLDRIFRQLNLSLTDLASIRELPGVKRSLDRLKPGDTITFVHDDGLIQTLTRRVSETEILTITRGLQGFASEVVATPIDASQMASITEALLAAGFSEPEIRAIMGLNVQRVLSSVLPP